MRDRNFTADPVLDDPLAGTDEYDAKQFRAFLNRKAMDAPAPPLDPPARESRWPLVSLYSLAVGFLLGYGLAQWLR